MWTMNFQMLKLVLEKAEEPEIKLSTLDHWKSKSEVAQSCPTLCDPMDCSLPCSSIRGILQARILEWVAIFFSRRSSQPTDQTRVSHIAGRHFTIWATREAKKFQKNIYFWNSLAFSMIQRMLAIWSLVPLPFLKPAWTSGSSRFTCCWSLAWRILSITLLACEMSAIVW